MAKSTVAADVDVGANLKPKVNGLIGNGDTAVFSDTATTTTTTTTEQQMELLQDGLSCSELFQNGEGLTYK